MLFTTPISLLLALAPTTIFAAPTQTFDALAQLVPRKAQTSASQCDLSNAVLPTAPTPLPAVGAGLTLRHVAIGRGTQNYTCASASATTVPVAVGAVASLFNATCDTVNSPAVVAGVTKIALLYSVPSSALAESRLSGHHEFTDKKVPLFKLETDRVNYGYVQAIPDVVKSSAPANSEKGSNGQGSVPWLKLNAVEGDYKEVYRVNTAGGMAPKTCEGISGGFTVDYAAQYWFYA
ncbi:hypothetical protein P153DRAFT_400803 [Dothidotthia symphoricarpi CBS 119687]|uniref:Malate dehydrogenase n=1 Tax=Dothidotthia symphoricarpi CBS 119687 TaxID=1392245 RepID=A0A6A5ZZK3_9PLEO|nr:uncharacterized protein P153DRAFT_400803 [Dothidotthia symphoricarpi CBS 119687]KAF2124716.1 hypothetical protein P153DRAFT_400803 [Dothidotthia symphoricarpi CBS 119687]